MQKLGGLRRIPRARSDRHPGSGGFPKFFLDTLAPMPRNSTPWPTDSSAKPVLQLAAAWMRLHQTLRPGTPIDLPFLRPKCGFFLRSFSHFDGNFSARFVDGTAGAGFDHATALAQITQRCCSPRNWSMSGDRIVGALTDDDVERAKSPSPAFDYVRLPSGTSIQLEKPNWKTPKFGDSSTSSKKRAHGARHRRPT